MHFKSIKYTVFGVLFSTFCFIFSCKKDKTEHFSPTPYKLETPSHFPKMPIPTDNPMTIEGIELGRMLFYEKKLSGDNTMNCASCHFQEFAFSDPQQFSTGITGEIGNRNSMALVNLGWQQFFFWDGRSLTLEDQLFEPVRNPIEMNQTWEKTVEKLKTDANYPTLFAKAFGDSNIDSVRVTKALAQFLRTLISAESKYDVMYKHQNNLSLTARESQIYSTITIEEWAGYDLFLSLNGADCLHCHNGPLMQVQLFSNNGLDEEFTDLGRMDVTGNSTDKGKFKIPTLRNIAYTAPYMHDGRFSTLDEVINHYSSGIQQSETIDPMIEFAHMGGVQLDEEEKMLLKAFLLCLSDENFINNPKFAKPE
jgi:cytochrome c peroxidase